MNPKLTLITDYSKGNLLWGGLTPGLLRTPWGVAATGLTETPAWQLHVTDGGGGWRPTLTGPIIWGPLLLSEPDRRLHVVGAGIQRRTSARRRRHYNRRHAGPRA